MTKRELKSKVNARSLSRKKGAKMSKTISRNYHKTAGRRETLRKTDGVSSTKVGAGIIVARRSLSMLTIHRRNHRTSEMIGPKY